MGDTLFQKQSAQIAKLKARIIDLETRIDKLEPKCRVRFGLEAKEQQNHYEWQVYYTSQKEFERLKEELTDSEIWVHTCLSIRQLQYDDVDFLDDLNNWMDDPSTYMEHNTKERAVFILKLFVGCYFKRNKFKFCLPEHLDWLSIMRELDAIASLERGPKDTIYDKSLDLTIMRNI